LCRRLGGAQGLSGQARKISPPPGFDPRKIAIVIIIIIIILKQTLIKMF
jgi:hypothetical protein